jgi:hypothetical protein
MDCGSCIFAILLIFCDDKSVLTKATEKKKKTSTNLIRIRVVNLIEGEDCRELFINERLYHFLYRLVRPFFKWLF